MKKIISMIATGLVFVFIGLILFASVRGYMGNPTIGELNQIKWRDGGPFELSPERGRFALLYSIVEDHSFFFSLPVARFTVPDLGYENGKYVSLFAPAVSFLAIPGYILGTYFGASQIGAFTTVSFFGFCNALLIYHICKRLGSSKAAGLLAGMIFIFASPAFAYAVILYQHHISTFIILCSIYLLLRYDNFWSLGLIWLFCGLSIVIDYPNLFLMAPIGILSLWRLSTVSESDSKIQIRLYTSKILSFLFIIFPLIFFLWFNYQSYGNPLQLSGTVGNARAIDEFGKPTSATKADPNDEEFYKNPDKYDRSAVAFFHSRYLLNGLYIHIVSPDRGIIMYTPIMFLALIGFYACSKKYFSYLVLMVSIIVVDILLYSMWGDPYGGWAFGSRYMIPSYALLSIVISISLTKLHKNIFFVILFWVLLVYSVGVNTLGSLTSNTNPPKVQVLDLEQLSGHEEKYTYRRNWDYLLSGKSKSFVFQTWAHSYVSAKEYYIVIAGSIVLVSTALMTINFFKRNNENT